MSAESDLLRELFEYKDFVISLVTPKTQEKHAAALEARFNKLISLANVVPPAGVVMDKLKLIEKKVDEISTGATTSFLSVHNNSSAKYKSNKKSRAVLIKPVDSNKIKDIDESVRNHVIGNPDIRVDSINCGTKYIKVVSPDIDIAEKIQSITLPEPATIKSAEKLQPQISFVVNKDQVEDVDVFIHRNCLPDPCCSYVKEINFKTKEGFDKTKIIARLSKQNRAFLANRGRVHVGYQSVSFKSDIHVKLCENCYKPGHLTKWCKLPKNTAAESVNDNHCPFCISAKIGNSEHKPKSSKCQVFLAEKLRIANITDWEEDHNDLPVQSQLQQKWPANHTSDQ